MERPSSTTADRVPVAEVMTRDALCVNASSSLETLTLLFLERGISGAPVVDGQGKPVGMISKTDLVRETYDKLGVIEPSERAVGLGGGFQVRTLPGAVVGDLMTPVAFTVDEDTSISQAAALMAYQQVHRVPVVSAQGKVVGVLSSMDILRWLGQEDGYLRR